MLGSPSSKYYSVHAVPRGAHDARPTALGIVNDEKLEGQWGDKIVFVTGGNAFVGAETVRALHVTGAEVFMTIRDTEKGQKAMCVHFALSLLPGLQSEADCDSCP
jgi:hypothetical protein